MSSELRLVPPRQCRQQVLHGSPLAGAHRKDARNGEQDAHGGNQHGGNDRLELHHRVARKHEGRGTQRGRGEDRAAVALVQVGAHAGHVAHVVAHVIGNGGGVARVVFRYARLYFAH